METTPFYKRKVVYFGAAICVIGAALIFWWPIKVHTVLTCDCIQGSTDTHDYKKVYTCKNEESLRICAGQNYCKTANNVKDATCNDKWHLWFD